MQALASNSAMGPSAENVKKLETIQPSHSHKPRSTGTVMATEVLSLRELVCLSPAWDASPPAGAAKASTPAHRGMLFYCGQVLFHHISLCLSTPRTLRCPFPSLLGKGCIYRYRLLISQAEILLLSISGFFGGFQKVP